MPEHFDELPMRVRFANEVAARHDAALEKIAIACQENALFAKRSVGQLVIVGAGRTDGVQAHQTQTLCELSEMAIDDEPNRRNRIGANARESGDVEAHKSRK